MVRSLLLATVLLTAACGTTTSAEAPTPVDHEGMAHAAAAPAADNDGDAAAVYACPMHPDVTSHEAGDCSKCGMALVKAEGEDHSGHGHGEHED